MGNEVSTEDFTQSFDFIDIAPPSYNDIVDSITSQITPAITDLVSNADIPAIADIIPITEGNVLDVIDEISPDIVPVITNNIPDIVINNIPDIVTNNIPDFFNNTIPEASLDQIDVIANYSKTELYNLEMQAMGILKDVAGVFVHNKGTIARPKQSQYVPPDDNSAIGAGLVALLVVGVAMYV
jgi:hypothetical protein